MNAMQANHLAVLGAGNIGLSIARGLVAAGRLRSREIVLTRRRMEQLEPAQREGFRITASNPEAVGAAGTVIVAVEPQRIDPLLEEIGPRLDPARHLLISVVSGVGVRQIKAKVGAGIPVVRAMPNTAIAIRESVTCLAGEDVDREAVGRAASLFDAVGRTVVIDEERMTAATALGACGVAFFLRAIRAASQGGIEIGFHTAEALLIAAQAARGAASLLLSRERHPEHEIDLVTTPRGCTISGLNQMEHEGFSSAMIKGIVTSSEKAARLYEGDGRDSEARR